MFLVTETTAAAAATYIVFLAVAEIGVEPQAADRGL